MNSKTEEIARGKREYEWAVTEAVSAARRVSPLTGTDDVLFTARVWRYYVEALSDNDSAEGCTPKAGKLTQAVASGYGHDRLMDVLAEIEGYLLAREWFLGR